MAANNNSNGNSNNNDDARHQKSKLEKQKRLEDLEAKAVAEAKESADSSFRPSPSLLNSSSPEALMSQVDGPPMDTYEGKESVYVGRSVSVAAGDKLSVPIQVSTPNSVVEYALEVKGYDLNVGITAEREDGITIVRKLNRIDVLACPLTQKFLVGTVPCMIKFLFDNEYSWIREKVISYKITVTPPSRESLGAGRRRRAKSCLKAIDEDLRSAQQRSAAVKEQKEPLVKGIECLEKQLEEKRKSLDVAADEEKWLTERLLLRQRQQNLLQSRLTKGWDDESPEEAERSHNEANGH